MGVRGDVVTRFFYKINPARVFLVDFGFNEEVSPKNSRNKYGRIMEFVRNLYGSSMEVVMEYGMELVWNNCGISVE